MIQAHRLAVATYGHGFEILFTLTLIHTNEMLDKLSRERALYVCVLLCEVEFVSIS